MQVISFEQCNGLRVHYLSIIDSPRAHVTVDGCNNAFFSHIYIRAPADSPNTDGFDISASKYITIKDSIVATGKPTLLIFILTIYMSNFIAAFFYNFNHFHCKQVMIVLPSMVAPPSSMLLELHVDQAME